MINHIIWLYWYIEQIISLYWLLAASKIHHSLQALEGFFCHPKGFQRGWMVSERSKGGQVYLDGPPLNITYQTPVMQS